MAGISTQVCIVGGGPAGMMLGLLLARAGVEAVVLEKHADFLRDFRGDTVHPSTLEVMWELGLLDRFLARPHDRAEVLAGQVGETMVTAADFRHLPVHAPFVAFMPQWEFLDFLADEARRYPQFRLCMQAEAVDLVETGGQVVGVRANHQGEPLSVEAALVVGCDGRHSTVRDKASLAVEDLGAPMDVLWMRLPRRPDDGSMPLGRIDAGRVFVMINRGDYFQCGYVVSKGAYEQIRERGLDWLKADIARLAPAMADRVDTLTSWDDIRLLTVAVDRLTRWSRPGLLCIGDAAHAMSPVGGIGINLAIQDAVAAANILWRPLKEGHLTVNDLEAVQARREPPTRRTQALQIAIQRQVIAPVLAASASPRPPWPVRLLNIFPVLRRIPARVIGMGFQPEHVRSPDAHG
jgi:2-polyprenyl-6-methoxyphenol hydroxylase-like FAD-dependent oxidoreductase